MKVRDKKAHKRLPAPGSVAWVEFTLGRVDEGLCAAEHDVRLLCESIHLLKQSHCWELLFPDEPRNWDRVVQERIDPVHKRVGWLQAVYDGYRKLRDAGRQGRISRRDAERAVGYSDGWWNRLPAMQEERSGVLAAWRSGPPPSLEPIDFHEGKSASRAAAVASIAAEIEESSSCTASPERLGDEEVEESVSSTSVVAAGDAGPLTALKQVWEAASTYEKEVFASWIATAAPH